MIQLFQRLYGTRVAPNIIKYNDFTDVGAYFLLKVCASLPLDFLPLYVMSCSVYLLVLQVSDVLMGLVRRKS